MSTPADRPRAPVTVGDEALRLMSALDGALSELEFVLEAQTALVGAGKIRDGLADEARKAELAGAYTLLLQHAKANVVALARLAPDALRSFRAKQANFERVMDRNQTVIATARAVSEGLIRSLAETVQREARPNVYGRPNQPHIAARSTSPLVFSGQF